LEIFASRASTREAKLQVESGPAHYDAPQFVSELALKKRGEQRAFVAPVLTSSHVPRHPWKDGQDKIGTERRGDNERGQTREEKEQGFDLVALAGYTNAGKSTLLNASPVLELRLEINPLPRFRQPRGLEIKGRRSCLRTR